MNLQDRIKYIVAELNKELDELRVQLIKGQNDIYGHLANSNTELRAQINLCVEEFNQKVEQLNDVAFLQLKAATTGQELSPKEEALVLDHAGVGSDYRQLFMSGEITKEQLKALGFNPSTIRGWDKIKREQQSQQ